jgi:hypothetical protein
MFCAVRWWLELAAWCPSDDSTTALHSHSHDWVCCITHIGKTFSSSGYVDSYTVHTAHSSSGYVDSYIVHTADSFSGYVDSYIVHTADSSSGYVGSYIVHTASALVGC